MAKTLKTKYGPVELFKNNPRTIRDNQFNALVESVDAHPEFMVAQRIVVWRVPEKLEVEDGEKCPFKGQEGKLIVLSGNQRAKSILALGKDAIPDDWCCDARTVDGEWWGWRDAEIFLNLANSPAGVSGDFDYEKLQEAFDEFRMRLAGIDFSNFEVALGQTPDSPVDEETGGTVEDEVEKGEHGEKSEELDHFISEREKTRRDLLEIDEYGFYVILVFESLESKIEFVTKSGLTGDKGVTRVDNGKSLVAVFESYDQKMTFLEKAGLLGDGGDDRGAVINGMFCDGREFAKRMGIELAETGLHFRNQIVDHQLEEMAMDPRRQKSEKDIQEGIYAELRAERESLGMPTGKGKGRKRKGVSSTSGVESESPEGDEPVGAEELPEWAEAEVGAAGDGVYIAT